MKNINGWWLPDSEAHLNEFIERTGAYQLDTLNGAVKFVPGRRNALDIGAHCGLWAKYLAAMFSHVYAFEPVQEHRDCFVENVHASYTLYPCALGEKDSFTQMVIDPENTGHTHIGGTGVEAPLKRLDDFLITDIDFIKMDCEGYEYYVCLGGKETIMRERPIICLEQKPHGFYGIDTLAGVKLLKSWGMVELQRFRADYVMGWK